MITKTANLYLRKKADLDDIWYKAKDLVGANDTGDKISYAARKGAKKVLGLFGGLKKNINNAINGGHDGSLSDRAAIAAEILSDKASRLGSHLSDKASRLGAQLSDKLNDVKTRAGRAYRAATDAYNFDER